MSSEPGQQMGKFTVQTGLFWLQALVATVY
jgi:hypothetical protein